jgi:hypothetical protein
MKENDSIAYAPSSLPKLARTQSESLIAIHKQLAQEAQERRAESESRRLSERSQRRMAIFANVMATIAAVMATIAAIPLIKQMW